MGPDSGDGIYYGAEEHEAETRRRWRALLDRGPDAMDPETGVAVQLGAPGRGFMYRPGQVLTHVDDAERVGNLLVDCGLDPTPLPRRAPSDLTGPASVRRAGRHALVDDRQGRVTEQVVRLRVPVEVGVPAALESVRTAAAGFHDPQVRVAPNHVFFGAQGWIKFGPGGAPIPVSRPTFDQGDYLLDSGAGAGVQVAVMDTGIMQDGQAVHPIFQGRYTESDVTEQTVGDFDPLFDGDGNLLALEAGHGTFIAGILATCAPGVRINNEASLYPNGSTDEVMLAEDLPDALAGAHVLNLSLGGYTENDEPPLTLRELLSTVPPGVAVVAAAGNSGASRPFWPAAFNQVIGVGAVRVDPATGAAEPAPFSNRGHWVNCCAAGVDVVSTFPPGVYRTADGQERRFERMARWSGTSFAAPLVAGLVAAATTTWGTSTAREAADRLLANADQRFPGLGPYLGAHLLRPAPTS